MGDNKKQKPLIYYYVMTILFIMVINTYIVPTFFSPKVHELSYGAFIQMVDEDKFSKVEITDKRIAALGKGTDEQQIYVTGRVYDPQSGFIMKLILIISFHILSNKVTTKKAR